MPANPQPDQPPAPKVAPRGGTVAIASMAVLFISTLALIAVEMSHDLPKPLAPDATTAQVAAFDMALQPFRFWAVVVYLVDLAAVAGVVLGIGYAATGNKLGIALSGWNDYSLSKLQMALWTIVVLSGLIVAAKINILGYLGSSATPLGIGISGDLLAAMGIASFTTAATPAILALKSSQTASTGETDAAKQRVAGLTATGTTADAANSGKAMGRTDPATASWIDMVTGDETANAGLVDLSKVQQLLITLLLVGSYTFMLIRMFANASGAIAALPDPGHDFVELLAVSHAGYLVYKAAPKSSQPPAQTSDGDKAGGATANAAVAPAPPPTAVPMRLAVTGADPGTVKLQVAGRAVDTDANGFADVYLEPGTASTVSATGTRGGNPVTGQKTLTPAADDLYKAVELTLA